MATAKSTGASEDAPAKKSSKSPADKGYIGRKAGQFTGEDYSLQSGPTSPGPADITGRVHVDDLKED